MAIRQNSQPIREFTWVFKRCILPETDYLQCFFHGVLSSGGFIWFANHWLRFDFLFVAEPEKRFHNHSAAYQICLDAFEHGFIGSCDRNPVNDPKLHTKLERP